jgi:hypothetical protein
LNERRGGAFFKSLANEFVPVEVDAFERHEEVAGTDGSGVRADARQFNIVTGLKGRSQSPGRFRQC